MPGMRLLKLVIAAGSFSCLAAVCAQTLGPPSANIDNERPEPIEAKPSPVAPRPANSHADCDNAMFLAFGSEVTAIDLASALSLGGVRNPQMLRARERVLEAVALRQYSAAQLLPSLHWGTSFDNHNGNLQQSNGNMLSVNRGSLYIGAGAVAVGAGTVAIPGIGYNLNVSDTLYKALQGRQFVRQQQWAGRAVENDMLRRIAFAYMQLLRAEGRRVLAMETLADAREVFRLTEAHAKAKQGRQADADRAATDLHQREAFLREAEGSVLNASTVLAQLLDLPPSIRLHPVEERVVPMPAVPDAIPLPELLAIAVMNRPELQEQQAAIRRAMLSLSASKVLPFSPNIIVGMSYGAEGGGSNLVAEPPGTSPFAQGASRFGTLKERADFDAAIFWSLQNLGIGNLAMIRAARSQLESANLVLVDRMDRVRAEVAVAYARTHARFARIELGEQSLQSIKSAFTQDMTMIKALAGRPIELLESLRLLGRSRLAYLDAIMDYNEAQMELYVALGQPPADVLARPVPPNYAPPKRM
jgi:outer membrane protein TolC